MWQLELQASNVTGTVRSSHLLRGYTLPVIIVIIVITLLTLFAQDKVINVINASTKIVVSEQDNKAQDGLALIVALNKQM